MQRPFTRVSLGGVHDESEIRGHRRTYIGALPGNIIQGIKKAGARNCVMMLDEIDKMGRGIQGDPSAAMLEVLDPEQNSTFRDAYLGVPFDLSRVTFITTANLLETIPGPLQDRMEIIALSGYTGAEKLQIARRYLVARQLVANGLTAAQASIDDEALSEIIHSYTREAGVRSLEREIGKVFRHVAVRVAETPGAEVRIKAARPGGDHGPAQIRERGGDAHERAGRRHGPGLDAGGRRHPVHRGGQGARQGQPDPHRPARRCDAGERAGGAEPHQEPRGGRLASIRPFSKRATSTSTCRRARRPRTGRARAWPCSPRFIRCSAGGPCAATPP